jgi:hypothetical protein
MKLILIDCEQNQKKTLKLITKIYLENNTTTKQIYLSVCMSACILKDFTSL